jgi:hypothetical protein
MTTITHHHLIRLDTPAPMSRSQEQPHWSPLIAPTSMPGPGDDEDQDDEDQDDEGDDGDEGEKAPILQRPIGKRHDHHVLGCGDRLDKASGRVLLYKALAELGTVRRRYAHLPELKPVFAAVEGVVSSSAEPEEARRMAAITYARHAMEVGGLDLRTAGERAVEIYRVNLAELLEALRARAEG